MIKPSAPPESVRTACILVHSSPGGGGNGTAAAAAAAAAEEEEEAAEEEEEAAAAAEVCAEPAAEMERFNQRLFAKLLGFIVILPFVRLDRIVNYTSSDPPMIPINDGDIYEFSHGNTSAAILSPFTCAFQEPFVLIREKDVRVVTVQKCLDFVLKFISVDQNGNIKNETRSEYRCLPDDGAHVKPLVIGLCVGGVLLLVVIIAVVVKVVGRSSRRPEII